MPTLTYRSTMPCSAEDAFAWHARPGAFERLIPPWERIRVIERSGGIGDGAEVTLEIRKGLIPLRWTIRHGDYEKNRQFADEQVRGPFSRWRHVHRFLPETAERSVLEDAITLAMPLNGLGRIVGGRKVRTDLARTFAFRHARTADDLRRHRAFRDQPRMRVAITGASGLIGRQLAAFLTTGGHRVDRLVRRAPHSGENEIYWNPGRGEIDGRDLEGVDAVVHLAGENIASGGWSAERKAAIRRSRVEGTRLLSEALAGLSRRPRVLISASAMGYYGNRGDEVLDESSAAGEGFLPEVCRAWEAATKAAEDAGIRVVHLRIGMVISAAGGALPQMLTPFKLGLGGRAGTGRQYISWIALDDLIGAMHHLLFADDVAGAVNGVAPDPMTNADFSHTLGRVLHRPTLLPAPAPMIRLLFGEMGQALVLEGARIMPRRLQESGFVFLYPDLSKALRMELGRFEEAGAAACPSEPITT